MHYGQFTQSDPRVLRALIESFPFATITVNGPEGAPVVAQAPLTFKQGVNANGLVEFHLARENPIVPVLRQGASPTIIVTGPSRHISPS